MEPTLNRPPLPPFDDATAALKTRQMEDDWNSRDSLRVAAGYTLDCRWRNRVEFITGRNEIVAFLTRKWTRELDYRLVAEAWVHAGARLAVRFAYEYCDDGNTWFRAYGIDTWEFAADGLLSQRIASINEYPIIEGARRFRWPAGPRPADHPGLSALGL